MADVITSSILGAGLEVRRVRVVVVLVGMTDPPKALRVVPCAERDKLRGDLATIPEDWRRELRSGVARFALREELHRRNGRRLREAGWRAARRRERGAVEAGLVGE